MKMSITRNKAQFFLLLIRKSILPSSLKPCLQSNASLPEGQAGTEEKIQGRKMCARPRKELAEINSRGQKHVLVLDTFLTALLSEALSLSIASCTLLLGFLSPTSVTPV
jgi:hypothetical protein